LASLTGAHVWSRRIGGASNDYGYALDIDAAGTVAVVGAVGNGPVDFGGATRTAVGDDAFLARYAASMALLDARLYGGRSSDPGRAVALDWTGGAYVGGYFNETGTFAGRTLVSAGQADGFVLRQPLLP
jgi:hypothetical protein